MQPWRALLTEVVAEARTMVYNARVVAVMEAPQGQRAVATRPSAAAASLPLSAPVSPHHRPARKLSPPQGGRGLGGGKPAANGVTQLGEQGTLSTSRLCWQLEDSTLTLGPRPGISFAPPTRTCHWPQPRASRRGFRRNDFAAAPLICSTVVVLLNSPHPKLLLAAEAVR